MLRQGTAGACDHDKRAGVLLRGTAVLRWCIGCPTARKNLRNDFPHVAQRARVPKGLAKIVVLGLQLRSGVARVMTGKVE